MGAVEPLCEKATEPLEHETEGDSGPGLEVLLEGCELEMDRRLIQDGLLDARSSGGNSAFSSTIR
jgi:hypothetical protein